MLEPLDPNKYTRRVPVTDDGRADWRELLEHDREALIDLLREMRKLLYQWPVLTPLVWTAAHIAYPFYRRMGHFIDESNDLADQTQVLSRAEMAFCQRQYTWSHVACSTAAVWDAAGGHMLCLRSLDWPAADAIARATRYFDFHNAAGETIFHAASLTGMVGVLTGVKPGAFSVVLNFAKAFFSARMRSDPTFLIRMLLANPRLRSYTDAVDTVLNWKVGAPCFITLCGIRRGEACVVEFPPYGRQPHLRSIGAKDVLVQTNHYDPDGPWAGLNRHDPTARPAPGDNWHDARLLISSGMRRVQLETGLQRIMAEGNDTLAQRALPLWQQPPVFNYETAHVVSMRPASGEIRAWTRAPGV